MSHVDDGTLHAYLDGELTPVESGRLDAHLAACPACRVRLEEERALIERASTLLSRAVPPTPERAAPPLHQLRRPRVAWRLRLPLAWAATVLMAVGIGWFLRGPTTPLPMASSDAPLDSATSGQVAAEAPLAAMPATRPEQQRSNKGESRQEFRADGVDVGAGTVADRAAREEQDEPPPVAKAADQLAQGSADAGLRAAAAPAPVAGNAIVVTAAPLDAARDALAYRRLSTVWPVIEPKPARDLLGRDPATIPGYPVRTMRRNPVDPVEILIEQELANGTIVKLYESRTPVLQLRGQADNNVAREAAPADRQFANERLARFLGSLRIEIAGPLSADSLNKLLQQVR